MVMLTTINPSTGVKCGEYQLMSREDVMQIIAGMHVVWQTWQRSALEVRAGYLRELAKLLLKERDALAALMTQEMGKPITQAKSEVEKCALLCDYYAQNGAQFLQPELVSTEFHKSYSSFQPLGIIFAIMPWNFPLWQVMRFAVPNLMAGNAGLLKHAPNVTGTALMIEQLFLTAGFPTGLFRSLVVDVSLAPDIIQHPYVAGVTLTGSERAGKAVASVAGAALKKVVLELGGSDPYIVLADADLELAANECVLSRLNNAGQVCIAAKRIIVVESVKDKLQELVLNQAKNYVMGSPNAPDTMLGPMAREDLRADLHAQVQRAIAAGARCVLGGVLPTGPGYYYPATVLLDVPVDSPAFREEMFGPVICITGAKDTEEAIALANDTDYGLAGAVFTSDIKRGEVIARDQISAGVCAVNMHVSSDPRLPFGGIKHSGYGRELARVGMHEFLNIKTVVVA